LYGEIAWINKSAALLGLEKKEQALATIMKSFEISKSNHITWYYKAKILSSMNKIDEALDALLVAVSLNPITKKSMKDEKLFQNIRKSPRFEIISK